MKPWVGTQEPCTVADMKHILVASNKILGDPSASPPSTSTPKTVLTSLSNHYFFLSLLAHFPSSITSMFRLSLHSRRSAIHQSTTFLSCLQSRTFSRTCTLQDGSDLYSTLLADLKQEDTVTKVRKKRVRSPKTPPISKDDALPATASKGTTRPKIKEHTAGNGVEAEEDVILETKKPRKTRVTKPKLLTPEQVKAKANRAALKEIQIPRMPIGLLHNPWSDVLRFLSSAYRSHTYLGDNKRAHVISESLCGKKVTPCTQPILTPNLIDDALERLEPTLERHVGCDIIDINPGVCLWSSKLHERLKPRKHILLEPDMKLYRPFILPLIDAPDSKYELVPKSGIVWSHLETVLTKQRLPFQHRFEKDDPKLENQNDTLLIVANLGYYPMKPYRGFSSLASLVLYQFMSATRAHSLFQRYGRVRFMVWTNDEEKRHLLPREIHQRRKTAVEAELTFEKICEIASSTEDKGPVQRERFLDLAKGREVLKKMEDSGVRTPPGRESVLAQEIINPRVLSSDASEAIWSMSAASVKEMRDLEAAFEAGEFAAKEEGEGKTKNTAQYTRLCVLRSQYTFTAKRLELFASLLEDYKVLAAIQMEIYVSKLAGEDTQEQEGQLTRLKEAWQTECEKLPDHFHSRLLNLLDNQRTFKNSPPLLAYDRREYEPLLVRNDEFYPPQPMCLLDFHPRQLWPALRDTKGNSSDVFEFILGNIFHLPTQSVRRALKSLWPGAYEWIIERCPTLTNPLKGGALDIEMLTVRCLTEEMLEEIVTAWQSWPFKPSKYELLSRMGSAVHDPDEIEIK